MRIQSARMVLTSALVVALLLGDVSALLKLPLFRDGAKHHAALRKRTKFPVTVDGDFRGGGFYYVNASVGTPGQIIALTFDTGSSDVWLFAPGSCDSSTAACLGGAFDSSQSSTFVLVDEGEFAIQYYTANSGVKGDYIADNFAVGGTLVKNLTMGLALQASYVDTAIMGVGFDAEESSVGNLQTTYPSFIDNLVSQSIIGSALYSVYLDDIDVATGTIVFGGIDTTKYSGSLSVLEIQPDKLGNYSSFSVLWQSIGLTDSTGSTILSGDQGASALPALVILDTGTAITYVPDTMFQTLANYFGAENDDQLGNLVSCQLGRDSNSNGTIDFGFGKNGGGPVISVPYSEIAVPAIDPTTGEQLMDEHGQPVCLFGVGSVNQLGDGAPLLFGDTFLRSAYLVYDLENKQVGLAQTVFNSTESNIVSITTLGNLPGLTVNSVVGGSTVTQSASNVHVAPGGSKATNTASVVTVPAPVTHGTHTSNSGSTGPGTSTITDTTNPTTTPITTSTSFTALTTTSKAHVAPRGTAGPAAIAFAGVLALAGGLY
ncbi:hypothetical protein ANO11243_056390 [Dothideomycetidae sp. 11243]|nr:hypothetical protein ANO11243_056390 [fungal sp. No.11243]